MSTVTFCLFTHIVSTEKVHKDMRDRKYMTGIKYTYYTITAVFWYCFYLKADWGLSYFKQLVYFIYEYENKRQNYMYNTYIINDLNIYRIIKLLE